MSEALKQRPWLLADLTPWGDKKSIKTVTSRSEVVKELLNSCTAEDREDPGVFALWEALSKSQMKG